MKLDSNYINTIIVSKLKRGTLLKLAGHEDKILERTYRWWDVAHSFERHMYHKSLV